MDVLLWLAANVILVIYVFKIFKDWKTDKRKKNVVVAGISFAVALIMFILIGSGSTGNNKNVTDANEVESPGKISQKRASLTKSDKKEETPTSVEVNPIQENNNESEERPEPTKLERYLNVTDENEKEITRSSITEDVQEIEIDTRTSGNLFAKETVNVREEPNTNCKIIGKFIAGNRILVYGTTSDGWSKIDYNGTEGYVKSEYLSESIPEENNEEPEKSNNQETKTAQIANETNATDSSQINMPDGGGGSNTGNPNAFASYVPTDAPAGTIIVNRNNGKIHHSACSRLPKEENRIYFNSIQEALNAGFSDPCGICKPF